jgi:hypothetical protein
VSTYLAGRPARTNAVWHLYPSTGGDPLCGRIQHPPTRLVTPNRDLVTCHVCTRRLLALERAERKVA